MLTNCEITEQILIEEAAAAEIEMSKIRGGRLGRRVQWRLEMKVKGT